MPFKRLLIAIIAVWTVVALRATTPRADDGQQTTVRPTEPHANLSLFTHSANCVACHNNLVSPSGEDVSIGAAWRATIMANSARDPYWHASVRREVMDHPTRAAEIQNECAACHMPMPQRVARAGGGVGEVFAHLPVDKDDTPLQQLAADGISCTVCHQIAPDTLGTRESFNANFVMRPTPPDGSRQIYGPYAVDNGRRTIMRSVSGFVQEEAPHIKQSELCASCHTLITKALGPDGAVIGELPEQMNYQEWRHSAFAREEKSCQSCHMPAAAGPIRISSVLGDSREMLARHTFVGGNAHMLRIFGRFRRELGVQASAAELEAAAQATLRQLQHDTATVRVSPPRVDGASLAFDVTIENLTGHKFPTGYPSRRTWLHAVVRDAQARVVFESGAVEPSGAIRGNDSDTDASRFEPHYEQITRADQVQIYEPILGDRASAPTTGLRSATQYLKDNRLLPRGFDKNTAASEIGVYGTALRDADFVGGGDQVTYRVPIVGAGPFRVEVALRYQSIAFRWARNLEKYDAREPKQFLGYYDATVSAATVTVATAAAR